MQATYLGRQPIFDRELDPVAYELLYRGEAAQRGGRHDARAAANVLVNAFLEMGVGRVLGRAKGFIQVTSELLDDDLLRMFPSQQLVLQLMADVAYDDERLARVDQLRAAGYGISVDNLLVHEGSLPLIERADYVKVDLNAVPLEELGEYTLELRRYPVALVAEKVETHEQFARCRELGFDFYQGYFFARPKLVASRIMAGDRLSVMQLLSILHHPNSELKDVQEAIQRSVSLSYRVLRYANSAAYNLPRKIESVAQAAVVLGQRRLRDMATLLALTGMDGKPQALTHTLLARARACALMAPAGRGNEETAFTVGLFSGLDALMDQPLDKLLRDLPLADETRSAILDQTGPFGEVLAASLALEQRDQSSAALNALNPPPQLYLEAADWATQALSSMGSGWS